MSNRKKGSASLFGGKTLKFSIILCCFQHWNQHSEQIEQHLGTYLRPVSSLPRKWTTTMLKTRLENAVKIPAMPATNKGQAGKWDVLNLDLTSKNILGKAGVQRKVAHRACTWSRAASGFWTARRYRWWPCIWWPLGWWCRCLGFSEGRGMKGRVIYLYQEAKNKYSLAQDGTLSGYRTSCALGHWYFQSQIWSPPVMAFMDMRQMVKAIVPTITSKGWVATNRPCSLKRRVSIVTVTEINGSPVNRGTASQDRQVLSKRRRNERMIAKINHLINIFNL